MIRLLVTFIAFAIAFSAQAAELGDDGLYKPAWLRDTSKDFRQDSDAARKEEKLLLLLIEQRGCIYCKKMHEEVFTDERVKTLLEEEFFPIQINLLGDTLLVDTDGDTLSEKDASAKWGAYSTPTIMALQPELNTTMSASQQAVAIMRGAFPTETTLTLLTHLVAWFEEEGHLDQSGEDFPSYYRRKMKAEES